MLQDLLPVKTAWEGGGDPRWRDIILLEAAQITQGERAVWILAASFFLPFSSLFPFLFFSPSLLCYPLRAKDESLQLLSKLGMTGCFPH